MNQYTVTVFICKLGEARSVDACGKTRNEALEDACFRLGMRDGDGFNVLSIEQA